MSDRLTRSERKIREGIGNSADLFEPFPEKAKGMHWKTYERLRFEAKQAQIRYCAIFSRKLNLALIH